MTAPVDPRVPFDVGAAIGVLLRLHRREHQSRGLPDLEPWEWLRTIHEAEAWLAEARQLLEQEKPKKDKP